MGVVRLRERVSAGVGGWGLDRGEVKGWVIGVAVEGMGGGDRPWGVGVDGLIGDKCPDRMGVVCCFVGRMVYLGRQ